MSTIPESHSAACPSRFDSTIPEAGFRFDDGTSTEDVLPEPCRLISRGELYARLELLDGIMPSALFVNRGSYSMARIQRLIVAFVQALAREEPRANDDCAPPNRFAAEACAALMAAQDLLSMWNVEPYLSID